ncbi:DNA-binding transcriptional regulator, MarR family [Enhydrobacter aerosaccus]|uniref:DNA-binding transcriptional regulator, MarR family n=1 Tax=Enhydrobacter aerosaccus TaxID=225324 RepID=A0A1T4MX03_9HYPH|nr:MarR family transcriptional regulator [Enhydrobacter aerosaccus]SJZ71532.1 DNA-binding transcriptional regulator, MarR family [Enhydrobacter aerosaccus]
MARQEKGRKARQPRQADYEALAEFRYQIRRFLEFSQNAAREAGLTPAQHQALLAIKGWPGGALMTIGDLAERLCVRHHSAVELIDRLAAAKLVVRATDPDDNRRVTLSLTRSAEKHLASLSAAHLDELARLSPSLKKLLARPRRRTP